MRQKRKQMKFNIHLSKIICNHLVGEEHTESHRIFVGVIIMIFGVGITVVAKGFSSGIVHFLGDGVGYLFHGLGGYPIIEAAINQGKQINTKKNG